MRNHFYKRERRWHKPKDDANFYKRQRRWHEPKDDATQTEWLALVFAVGCLVVLWVIGHWWSEGL